MASTGRFNRRHVIAAGTAAAAFAATGSAFGQGAWPNKPIKIIVGFPAGGLTDAYARAYGETISQKYGQPVVVENKPGAGSIIACETVAKSPPDGYTFLFTISTAFQQNQVLYKSLPYDPNKDFTFIAGFDAGQLPLAVHKSVGAQNMKEFVELAKKDRMTMGTYSPGSYPHMVAQQLNKLYGTKLEAVHYRGEAPMWQDVASGAIHAGIGSFAAQAPHIQAGNIRPIGVPTKVRSPKLPDTPTFFEQGYAESIFVTEGWIGMLGPAGLPREIVDKVWAAIKEGADTERHQTIRTNFGLARKPWSPEEFERLFRVDGQQWIALARELGVTLD